MTEQERKFHMSRRQALIMELGALEDLLGMERSIVPKRKRGHEPIAVYLPGVDENIPADAIQIEWPD